MKKRSCALFPHFKSQKKICSNWFYFYRKFAQVIDFYKQEQSQSSLNSQSDKGIVPRIYIFKMKFLKSILSIKMVKRF